MVNTRKRKYDIDIYTKGYDQFSLTSTSQSDLSFMGIDEMDLIPNGQIHLNLLRKHTMKPKSVIVKLFLVTVLLLLVTVHRYVYSTITRQDDITKCNVRDSSFHDIYTKLQELNLELKLLKTKCNKNNILPLSNILKYIDERVERALMVYDADKIGIIDYAIELSGGSITSTPDTSPFYRGSVNILEFFNSQYTSNPSTLIQPGTLPGQCFAFKGPTGRIRFQLMHLVYITAVTLEHTHRNLVIDTTSAPKDFRVYGLDNAKSTIGHDLGLYEYKLEGNPTQTFTIKNKDISNVSYKHVELQILSNYGNPQYTCLYRFRVHGDKV